jgi:hypothetical protein
LPFDDARLAVASQEPDRTRFRLLIEAATGAVAGG